jgi:hypothetical protein
VRLGVITRKGSQYAKKQHSLADRLGSAVERSKH